MNPEQLLETAMSPKSRELLRVELGDETDADEIFFRLMGDQVEPRREFIEQNALNVSSLVIRECYDFLTRPLPGCNN